MEQIVLDTETTGIGPGHKIIEIGCVLLQNRKITDKKFHTYLNPQREVDPEAAKVHGLELKDLLDKPLFAQIMPDFLEFVEGKELIIHNAPFDVGFLNTELKIAKCTKVLTDYCTIFDTLVYARKKHPGQKNNLDALCKRYFINNSHRQWHGALLDAAILAEVYLAMTGGQIELFAEEKLSLPATEEALCFIKENALQTGVVLKATAEELAAHAAFVAQFLKKEPAKKEKMVEEVE
jgi:DNA polymerase-3 subunit epsilon